VVVVEPREGTPAYRASQVETSGRGGAPAAGGGLSDLLPAAADRGAADALALLLVRAMIAAAQADGRLDGAEGRAIAARIDALGLDPASRADLLQQLVSPVDVGELVASVPSREAAIEVYTASLLAVDLDSPAERAYFQLLAARLDLPDELVRAIHEQVDAGTPRQAAQPSTPA
jgi:uncharacterized membrane protein YebE (DUF533 family)